MIKHLIIILLLVFQINCNNNNNKDSADNSGERSPDWTEQSHGKNAVPDYDIVFPNKKVQRMDFVITSENWEVMWQDMTEMLGEFGNGGNDPADNSSGEAVNGPSEESIVACKDKNEMDDCDFPGPGGMELPGKCIGTPMGNACVPDIAIEACEGKTGGDSCTMNINGMSIPGTCVGDLSQSVCSPDQGAPGSELETGNGGGKLDLTPGNPVYVPCTVVFNGKKWTKVGIRFKGNSSLAFTWKAGIYKLALRLDLDKFEDEYPDIKNQRFFGFKELSLANQFTDLSLMREKVTADIFRKAGVPAPMTAYYSIYIDKGDGPTYFGLYTMVEVPRSPMFDSQFIKSGGNLYKPDGQGATWVAFNEESFAKKTNKSEKDYSDIQAAINALHKENENIETWRDNLNKFFNIYGFVKWLAVNTVMTNWDSYGNAPHNYFLYGDPGDGGRLHWIPWDNNMAFDTFGMFSPLPLDMKTVDEKKWPLIAKVMADEVLQPLYVQEIEAFIKGAFQLESVKSQLKEEHELIMPYVIGKDGEKNKYTHLTPGSENEAFTESINMLFDYVEERKKAAEEFLQSEGL